MKSSTTLLLILAVFLSNTAWSQQPYFRPGMVQLNSYKTGDTIGIMAFNTENFIDAKNNLYIDNRSEDEGSKDAGSKEKVFVEIIKKANAAIVMVSEFETVAYLREMNQKYNLGYTYFASSESQTWYQNTMIMSKVPIGTFRSYGSVYSPLPGEVDAQGNPATQTNINARMWIAEVWPTTSLRMYLCGVHLKAGRNRSDTATRTGQIQLLKGEFARIMKENKKAPILMAGDFNATPESEGFRLLLSGNRRTRLIDPLAGTTVYSHPAGNPRWRIDHMVYNRNFAPMVVKGSTGPVYILNKPEMAKFSDHLPLLTKIVLK